jgi:hypothetical protein
MKRHHIYLVFVSLFFSSVAGYAQAVKLTYAGISTMRTGQSARLFYFGGGYEQNLLGKLSVSIDYNQGYAFDISDDEYYYQNGFSYGGTNYYNYIRTVDWHEFAYQTKYFFIDNTSNSWYFSMGLSLLVLDYELKIQEEGSSYGSTPIPVGTTKNSSMVFPVTARIGFRSNLTGFVSDFGFGLSFLPGKGDYGSGNEAADLYVPTNDLHSVYLTVGCSLGFGWARE